MNNDRHTGRDRTPAFFCVPEAAPEPRNPERTVGRWMLALAIVAGVLLIMGVI